MTDFNNFPTSQPDQVPTDVDNTSSPQLLIVPELAPPTPTSLYERYKIEASHSGLDIADITLAERPILANESRVIVRQLIIKDDERQTLSGSEGVVRSKLFDEFLVDRKMKEFYRTFEREAINLSVVNMQRKEVKQDMRTVYDHIDEYKEIAIAADLLSELFGQGNISAADAMVDLLCSYSRTIQAIQTMRERAGEVALQRQKLQDRFKPGTIA